MKNKPETFNFREDVICEICGTNESGEGILIVIDGTQKDFKAEAVPIHLWCGMITNYNRELGIFYCYK